jgi:hypothetical protein
MLAASAGVATRWRDGQWIEPEVGCGGRIPEPIPVGNGARIPSWVQGVAVMDDDIQSDKHAQRDDRIAAKKPSASADQKENPFRPSDDHAWGRPRRWAIRLLLGLATGTIVSSTAFLCAWYQYRDYHYYRLEQAQTRDILDRLQTDVHHYQQVTGHLPNKLTDLESVQKGMLSVDSMGDPVDSWGHPIQYRIEADGVTLFSYGRDGQAGGRGLDADLYAGIADEENEHPTLWQFATILDNGGMMEACLLAGAFAFAVCLIASAGWRGNRSLAVFLAANALTALFAILTAVVISALHLPSGH